MGVSIVDVPLRVVELGGKGARGAVGKSGNLEVTSSAKRNFSRWKVLFDNGLYCRSQSRRK